MTYERTNSSCTSTASYYTEWTQTTADTRTCDEDWGATRKVALYKEILQQQERDWQENACRTQYIKKVQTTTATGWLDEENTYDKYRRYIEAFVARTDDFVAAIARSGAPGACRIVATPQTPLDKMKDILKSRMAPTIITSRKSIVVAGTVPETRARETLRRVIGDESYRLFLKNGFLTVKGKSGRFYQIFPGHDFTRVWENGKMIEQLCVVLSGTFPPTDALLMRYCILLNDEEHFASLSNKHGVRRTSIIAATPDIRPLVDIYASIKSPTPCKLVA